MQGIILAGGRGTRLRPMTELVNKHCLPVGDDMMITYPATTLREAGVTHLTIVVGPKCGTLIETIGDGTALGFESVSYVYQEEASGIPDALAQAEFTIDPDEPIMVVLGDNYFDEPIDELHESYLLARRTGAATIFTTETYKPWDFGILLDGIVVEKPNLTGRAEAVVGLYVFPPCVWDRIYQLIPSKRGELEIADLLNMYAEEKALHNVHYPGYWKDMGTLENWVEVNEFVNKPEI